MNLASHGSAAGRFKVIQVSIPQSLLDAVTHYAKERKESRAVFIRRALERYLAELREQEMEEAYIRGYQRIPEEVSVEVRLDEDDGMPTVCVVDLDIINTMPKAPHRAHHHLER